MYMSNFSGELIDPTTADRFKGLEPVLRPLTTTVICRCVRAVCGVGCVASGQRVEGDWFS